MPQGISPKLPLSIDSEDGKYTLNKTLKEAIAQNLKNLVLTAPGERIMNPDFGVGIRNYLFRENSTQLYSEIEGRIVTQVGLFMPFLKISNVKFISSLDDPVNISDNAIYITIFYNIIPLGSNDRLDLLLQ
jgi:phage baseplate assembly protein W